MKLRSKIVTAALTGSIVAAPLAIGFASPASAAIINGSRMCSENSNFGLASHGQCVSQLETHLNRTVPPGICHFFQEADPSFFNSHFKNIGECVSVFAPGHLPDH